jgi:hypothetical protein
VNLTAPAVTTKLPDDPYAKDIQGNVTQ